MEIDDFLDLVRKRRSVREYKSDTVPDEYIEKILEAGRWAMSGANGQPWEFLVVKNRETINEIEKIYTSTFRQSTNTIELTRIEEMRQPTILRSLAGVLPGWKDAPVIIAILCDLRIIQVSVASAAVFHGQIPIMMGVANATMIMHLAAASLGLGSQWVSIGPPFDGKFKELLGVPDRFEIHMMMPIGYPAGKLRQGYRRELSEIVHHEQYDMSKFRSDKDIINWIIKLRKIMKQAYPIGK